MTDLQNTIRKINEICFTDIIHSDVDLEMLLVALQNVANYDMEFEFKNKKSISIYDVDYYNEDMIGNKFIFTWQLNKTLTEQEEKDQQIIINIFK